MTHDLAFQVSHKKEKKEELAALAPVNNSSLGQEKAIFFISLADVKKALISQRDETLLCCQAASIYLKSENNAQ